MTALFDVAARLAQLRQIQGGLSLYALVDGVQYQALLGHPCMTQDGFRALFAGTPDAALAHAGPWLIDCDIAGSDVTQAMAALEQTAPAVTWLITLQTLDGLAQLLQLNLNATLPDGRAALIRFWDPRVLVTLAKVLQPDQREELFGHIYEWHLLHQGRRTWIGRPHAQA